MSIIKIYKIACGDLSKFLYEINLKSVLEPRILNQS